MAILKNSTPFDSIRGKFSGTDQIHFRNRTVDNATIGVRVKHPYSGEPSANQLACQTAFTTAQEAVKTAMADSTQLATYTKAFKAQKKYKTLRGYIFSKVYVAPTDEEDDNSTL